MFLATAPTGVLTAGTAGLLKQIYGKGVAHLWKNEGVAPLRELLYSQSHNVKVWDILLHKSEDHLEYLTMLSDISQYQSVRYFYSVSLYNSEDFTQSNQFYKYTTVPTT